MNNLFFKLILCFVFNLFSACSYDEAESEPDNHQWFQYQYSNEEYELLTIINNYRKEIGKVEFQVIDYLSITANQHNAEMIKRDQVGHFGFEERVKKIKSKLNPAQISENIAYNYLSSYGAFHAWMQSENHRSKIEGNFTHVGISISKNPKNGRLYYTQIFILKEG